MSYSFFLSTIDGGYNIGTFFICYGLISIVRGNFRLKVKNGLLGSFNCSAVRVLSSEVTAGNLSTLFPVILATQ